MKLLLIFLTFLLIRTSVSIASVINVPADQATIQDGINAAVDGDTVLVAPGTYTGSGNRDILFFGKKIVLTSSSGAESTIIDCQGSSSEPHRGFSFKNGEDSLTIVNGLTVRNGYGLEDVFRNTSAGGAFACLNTSPLISNCRFINNFARAGGACVVAGSRPIIRDCYFDSNSTPTYGFGGAIYLTNNSELALISNCIIQNNSAGIGGGFYSASNALGAIRGCTIVGNNAVQIGGGGYSERSTQILDDCLIERNTAKEGGGLYGELSVTNSTFTANNATVRGGAVRTTGISTFEDCKFIDNISPPSFVGGEGGASYGRGTFRRCDFVHNVARAGGAIYSANSDNILVEDCNFNLNHASAVGGAIVTRSSKLNVLRSSFTRNSANELGGAIYCIGATADLYQNLLISNVSANGGALAMISGIGKVRACTFYDNETLGVGGCIATSNNVSLDISQIIVADSRVGAAFNCILGGALEISCSNVHGNANGDWNDCFAEFSVTNGNVSKSPAFCGAGSGNFTLNANSICAPANNSCGLLIGALPVVCDFTCGDINNDGIVSEPDYLAYIDFYFGGGPPPNDIDAAEVDCDGIISIADIVYLANFIDGVIPALCCSNTLQEPWRHYLYNESVRDH